MNFSPVFFKATAFLAVIIVLTAIVSWVISFWIPSATDVTEQAALLKNPLYAFRQWLWFPLPFLFLFTYLGITMKRFDTAPGLCITGFIFFFFRSMIDLVLNSVSLFALNSKWIPQAAKEIEESSGTTFVSQVNLFQDISAALLVPLFLCILLGSLVYGLATWKGSGLDKIVSVLFFVACLDLLLWSLISFGGQAWLAPILNPVRPFLTPVRFTSIAFWLWKGNERTN